MNLQEVAINQIANVVVAFMGKMAVLAKDAQVALIKTQLEVQHAHYVQRTRIRWWKVSTNPSAYVMEGFLGQTAVFVHRVWRERTRIPLGVPYARRVLLRQRRQRAA